MARKPKEDDEFDDEFASPSPAEADDKPANASSSDSERRGENAGESPRMNPRTLARTPTSENAGLKSRKQRIRKRSKPPRQKKDQLNGRVPEYVIYGVRDWCDEQGITEIGEGMTLLIEGKLNDEAPETIAGAYADWCVEHDYYKDRDKAFRRYLNGDD